MSFSLRQKIFLGYIVMISFTLLVGIYAIFSLKELNAITRTIVFNATAINEKLTRLNDSILAQVLYEKRSLLLQQQDAENLFWTRSREFRDLLGQIGKTETFIGANVEMLISLHEKYNSLFTKEIQLIKERKNQEAEELSGHDLKSSFTTPRTLNNGTANVTRKNRANRSCRCCVKVRYWSSKKTAATWAPSDRTTF